MRIIDSAHELVRVGSLVLVVAVVLVAGEPSARAQCTCPSGGIPSITNAAMKGNDLNEVKGNCAPPRGRVELQVYQQHLARQEVCPPRCPTGPNYSFCINQ